MTIQNHSKTIALLCSAAFLANTGRSDQADAGIELRTTPAAKQPVQVQTSSVLELKPSRTVTLLDSASPARLAAQADLTLTQSDASEPVRAELTIGNWDLLGGGSGRGRTLVIHSGNLGENTTASIEEDMAIMSRILSKTISAKRVDEDKLTAMGIYINEVKTYALGPGRLGVRSVFLDGYGALFLFHVPFPLIPPAEKAEDEKPKTSDSAWERAKRELFGPKESWSAYRTLAPVLQSPAYDEARVEKMKDTIIDDLKNASNIRALQSEHFVTVTLVGPESAKPVKKIVQLDKHEANRVLAFADSHVENPGETLMTFRVRKGDVDAFSKGEINRPQFKERVTITTY